MALPISFQRSLMCFSPSHKRDTVLARDQLHFGEPHKTISRFLILFLVYPFSCVYFLVIDLHVKNISWRWSFFPSSDKLIPVCVRTHVTCIQTCYKKYLYSKLSNHQIEWKGKYMSSTAWTIKHSAAVSTSAMASVYKINMQDCTVNKISWSKQT